MIKNQVDLIVLEGMARALHTNLYAKMTCECLKLAVVKNRWLALRLGGDMFAVICKYEQPSQMKFAATNRYNDDNEIMYESSNEINDNK